MPSSRSIRPPWRRKRPARPRYCYVCGAPITPGEELVRDGFVYCSPAHARQRTQQHG